MAVEFIGMIQTRKVSETHAPQGPAIDIGYVEQFARAHEEAGFDRVLVPHHSTGPDALLTVAHAASVTPANVTPANVTVPACCEDSATPQNPPIFV